MNDFFSYVSGNQVIFLIMCSDGFKADAIRVFLQVDFTGSTVNNLYPCIIPKI